MSTESHDVSAFARSVETMVNVLTEATTYVAAADRAQEEKERGGRFGAVKRRFGRRPQSGRAEAAADEVRHYGAELVERYRHAGKLGRYQLEREVEGCNSNVPRTVRWNDLDQAASHGYDRLGNEPRQLAGYARKRVAEALERITPFRGRKSPSDVVPGLAAA